MTIEEENEKKAAVVDQLSHIFLSTEMDQEWITEEPTTDLTNLDGGVKLYVDPVTALSVDEVKSFTVVEDVQGTIETTFIRKS